jgi:hypothetical protein
MNVLIRKAAPGGVALGVVVLAVRGIASACSPCGPCSPIGPFSPGFFPRGS